MSTDSSSSVVRARRRGPVGVYVRDPTQAMETAAKYASYSAEALQAVVDARTANLRAAELELEHDRIVLRAVRVLLRRRKRH